MRSIRGETIWITGASSGIGKSMALLLAERGNQVVVSARTKDALEELVALSDNITALPFDVSDRDQVEKVTAKLFDLFPYIDRVILNAGSCEYLDANNLDWDMMRRVMDVNYFGSINTIEAAMPLLRAKPGGGGHIIGVVSMAAFVPFSRAEAYGSSKAALQYFLDSLRVDISSTGIDITVVNPGFVKTPLTDKNDFNMPFLVPVDVAAKRIVRAIACRPMQYDFPFRLKFMLKTLGFFPGVWKSIIAPSLRQ